MPIFFPKIKLIFLQSLPSERLSEHSKLSYLELSKSLCNPEETKALTSSDCLAVWLVRELRSAETCRWIRYCRDCEWHSLQKQNFVGSENPYKIHEKQLKPQVNNYLIRILFRQRDWVLWCFLFYQNMCTLFKKKKCNFIILEEF